MAVVPQKKEKPAQRSDVVDMFSDNISATRRVSNTHTEELVIALCGPIGSPLHDVADAIEAKLEGIFGYSECRKIRLSDLIQQHAHKVGATIDLSSPFKKINSQIDVGNALRDKYGSGILAELAVHSIRSDRERFRQGRRRLQSMPLDASATS